jgi:hypothetical protein
MFTHVTADTETVPPRCCIERPRCRATCQSSNTLPSCFAAQSRPGGRCKKVAETVAERGGARILLTCTNFLLAFSTGYCRIIVLRKNSI